MTAYFSFPFLLLLLLLLLLLQVCLFPIARSASSPHSKDLLGIPPEDASYFKSEIIKCKDGSKKFTKSQLNDDFCDCPDGTDEPGTSACPRGKFFCQNAGHVPLLLFSSRVNDGICDCCDGSDEYDGSVNCPNTCWEAGKVARAKLIKKIKTYQEGVLKRKQEVEQAKQAIAKDESELAKLKKEEQILKGLVQQLKERKEQIEKVEEKERLAREEEEKRKKESEEKAKKESEEKHSEEDKKSAEGTHDDHNEIIGSLDEPFHGQDVAEVKGEPKIEADNDGNVELITDAHENTKVEAEISHDTDGRAPADHAVKQEKDENTEGLSREELGRLVASRWTGENAEQQPKEVTDAKEANEESQNTEDNTHDEDYNGYSTNMDGEHHKYDEDEIDEEDMDDEIERTDHGGSDSYYAPDSHDYSDLSDTSSLSWWDKIQKTVRNILDAVNVFQTPVNISDAAHVRKEYDETSAKLSKIQARISSLSQKLKHDFGPEKEFYSFYDHCFENKHNKYTYKVCPFKQASQIEGHSTTGLGHWEKFDDSFKVMVFSNGDRCWNGPDRSLRVRIRCGLKNELTDVDEPSRCEYVAVLSTPVLCHEEKLKELQNKLDQLKLEQPHNHEEL